jgi:cob(I)alamin adenosyltransferase
MLYTRKGDNGTSELLGTKERFPKNSPIFEALGTLDELNSLLGICRAQSYSSGIELDVALEIKNVQESLFIIQAELANADKSLSLQQIRKYY